MGNGKSKEGGGGGKGGLLAVSRNSLEASPPTRSNTSLNKSNKLNIYMDDQQQSPPTVNNTTTNNNNNTTNNNNNKGSNGSLHQSQLSNGSVSSGNNDPSTTTNNNVSSTIIQTNNQTDTSYTSSSPNAISNSSTSGGAGGTAASIVFGVDVSVAVQRSCKLILQLLLKKKEGNEATVTEEEVVSEDKKNEYKHPLASDEEIQAIESACANLEKLFIPEVIRQCLRFLNSYDALHEKGVYRIPGDTQKLREYREIFDRGQTIDFLAENREIDRKRKEAQENGVTVDIVHHGIKHDAHDVAGLIKLFLRELPGEYQLFTPQTAPEFTFSYLKNFATEEDKVESVRSSLLRVPRACKDTLKALCEHFRLVIKYEKFNKMSTDNLLKCICGTSPYVSAFYFMVQYFDMVFKEEPPKEQPKSNHLTEEEINSTKNIEWLLRAQSDDNPLRLPGNLAALTGGNNNLSNEALAGKAMSARESRRKSYYQRQQRETTTSEDTPTTTDNSDFNSPPTMDGNDGGAVFENLDPITQALLKMKKDKETHSNNDSSTIVSSTNTDSPQEESKTNTTSGTSSIAGEI